MALNSRSLVSTSTPSIFVGRKISVKKKIISTFDRILVRECDIITKKKIEKRKPDNEMPKNM